MPMHSKNIQVDRTTKITNRLATMILCFASFSVCALDNTDSDTRQAVNVKQSFLSCSIITSEHLTALQLYQRGIPRELAADSLPNISRDGKKRLAYIYDWVKEIGILNAYADINTNYARCSTLVYKKQGRPAPDLKEYAYYFCSGENKIRYEIMLKLDRNHSIKEITKDLPASFLSVAQRYKILIKEKGTLAAFDLTANNLKACLQQIE